MAGHSHWANIAHKKALIDNKRGKLWSKLAKAIIVAAKAGGGDPDANLRLRYAIIDAKAGNMPKDTIDRAIKKGTGELEGVNFEEILYEGYGPGGVAVLCDILTDNRNRTAGEVRKIFEMAGGKLGATGCVAWMFDRKGLLVDSRQPDRRRSADGARPRSRRRRRPPRRRQLRSHLRARTSSRAVCDAIDKAGLTTEAQRDHAHPQGHGRSRRRRRPAACSS